MSQCIHCDKLKQFYLFHYCYQSRLTEIVTETSVNLEFKRIPDNIINSDSDTPEWCPRGLK